MHSGMNEWGRRLAALAAFDPPADGWTAVLAVRRQRESRMTMRWPAALAAVVLAAALGLGWWLQSAQRELTNAALPAPTAYALASDVIRAQNERLEWMLATLPEPHAMRGSTAFTLAEIEDRLALLDDRLSRVTLEPNAPERAERLWQERVDLMNSLVQVRYADAIGSY
jgi:hypothetical protein